MCDRFKCLPSALMNESTELLELLAIETEGVPRE
jgi:hypothetical protein